MTISESEITATKEMFQREKQHLFKEIITLKERLSKGTENTQDLNKKLIDYEDQIKELKNDLEVGIVFISFFLLRYPSTKLFQVRTAEALKELKIRQNTENRVKEQQKQIEVKEKENENIEFQFHNAKEQIKLLENTVNEQKVRMGVHLNKNQTGFMMVLLQLTNELLSQNNSHLSQKILKLQTDYSSQLNMLEELTQKCSQLSNQTKVKFLFSRLIIECFLSNLSRRFTKKMPANC